MPYRILLYYKYTTLPDYQELAERHLAFCKRIGVLGRIIVAPEGINGTVSGTVEQTDEYIAEIRSDERLRDMVFKCDDASEHAFDKIFVRARDEIVSMHLTEDIDPNELSGIRLSPDEFYRMMQRDDVVIIDGRNDYEYDIGHFRNAIRPEVRSFREFPEWIRRNLSEYKDKTVLAYCTGGVRCEKLTGFLLREGFGDVYHLDGGIAAYSHDQTTQGKMFEGKMYVFDKRVAVDVNYQDPSVVSQCAHCHGLSDRYINCSVLSCHKQHFCCPDCEERHSGLCPDCLADHLNHAL